MKYKITPPLIPNLLSPHTSHGNKVERTRPYLWKLSKVGLLLSVGKRRAF